MSTLRCGAVVSRFYPSLKLTGVASPNFLLQNAKYSTKGTKDEVLPKNVVEDVFTASQQKDFGIIYDKKPFKMKLVPNKKYNWCCCGHSKTQPMCDGSHKNPYVPIKLKPVRFQVEEEKDYWLCNCKQTRHRPFCDGTHKREDIQAKK